MAFITHIPGTVPVLPPQRHPKAKGVGVIGLHEGRTLLLSLATRTAYAYPAAGCDLSADKLTSSRAELPDLFYTTDYRAMLARPEVEIVAVYTPDKHHADHITQAFEAGKDVICTKPIVNSLQDAKRVLDVARLTGRKLLVGQSTRFFEPFRRQRAAFERGELGKVELLDAHYIHRMDWYYDKSPWVATDTDWVFLGLSHPLDLVRWYLGPIASVHAFASRSQMGQKYNLRGNDIYVVNAVARSGQVGRAMGHYGVHELPSARNCIELMLYGSAGSSLAQYHDMKYIHTAPTTQHDHPAEHKVAEVQGGFHAAELAEITEDCLYAGRHYYFNSEVHGMHYGEFANYADYFARSLLANAAYSPNLEEGLETFCLMEAVRRSSLEGRPVEVAGVMQEIGLEPR
jgi:predicted dehydrogenase